MSFDLDDEELLATREMNKTAWESEIDKWSKEYLIERYKDLVEIEKEHKKENGELREKAKKLEFELEIKKYCKVNELIQDLVYYKNLARAYQGNSVSKDKLKKVADDYESKGYIEIAGAIQELLEKR